MNENQDYEKSLDDAVERLVHGKKASGNPTLDALEQLKPQADPAFMNHLEERLMAELSTSKSKKELAMLKRKNIPSRIGRWPLTLAAAVMAILLVGGWVLYANQKPMQVAASATASPIAMVPVVIAIQDIPVGTEITPDTVGVIMYPAELVPRGAFESIEAVVGYYAATNIYTEELILARKLLETAAEAEDNLECPEQGMPHGIYVVQEGDTMMSISTSTGRSVHDILAMNCMDSAEFDNIQAGDTLLIPLLSNVSELGSNGCDSFTSLANPHHGQLIRDTIAIEGSLKAANFGEAKLEISGPSTNNEFIVLATIPYRVLSPNKLGDFVPASYDEGEYLFRLTSFDTMGEQIGVPCTKMVYVSHSAYPPVFSPANNENVIGGMTPVVIALRDIAMNTQITAEMVALTYWPSDVANAYSANNPGQWPSDNLEDVIGRDARVFFPAFEPISRDDLYDNDCNPQGNCSYPIPNGYVSIIYQTTDKAVLNFPTGSHVDVMVAMVFSDAGDGFQCLSCTAPTNLVMQRTIRDAIILYKELLHPNGQEEVVVMLAVPEQEVNVFAWLAEADLPMMLVPHMEGDEVGVPQSQALNNVETPQTTYYVAIPLNQIESIAFGLYQGDTVNVYLNNSEMSFSGIVSYTGNSQYAPDEMQSAVESITQGNKDVLILSVASMDIVEATNNYASRGLSFEMVTISNSTNPNPVPSSMTIEQWFDASALSFNVGDNVDVIAQFTYLDENGEAAGMIRQRMGVDMLITSMEAGTGESAAYALVGLTEQNLEDGQMLASFQTCCHGTGATQVLESWILVPYNQNLGASTEYFGYNERGEAVPLEADSLAEGRYYAALPLLHTVQSVAGGMSVGDNVSLLFADGSSIDAQISYLGSALYAPFAMQVAVDSFRAESPRTIILEVANPEDAATITARVEAGESMTLDMQR
jgi:Flp pilus assembly protein CpaB